ncbi:MAG: prolipoprotein diacylglyceryl transferase [Elusimicrobiales bacterium]|nr:prolipoprotein diacylglyceryl transferase [Elusimicrobiales bacterium]
MHPYLFKIGDFSIPTYGILVAAGYLISAFYIYKRNRPLNISREQISDMILFAIIAALLGGKLFYVIIFWDDYGLTFFQKAINALKDFRYGFVFYGGLITSTIFLYFYLKKKKINFLAFADIAAPGIVLGHAIGRIGCFFAGCCHGKPTDFICAVTFNNPESLVSPALIGVPVHPTQLYSSAANFIIFIALHFMLKASLKHNWKKGLIAASYLLTYSIARFAIEIFRGDARGNFIFAMSPSQIISLSGALIALLFFYFAWKNKTIAVKRQ